TLKTLSGGAFTVGGTGILDGSTPGAPVNNAAHVTISDGATLALRGTINNAGSMTLKSIGSGTFLQVDADAALQGGGKITLSDNPNNVIVTPGAAVLTNVDNTIAGAGDLSTTIINETKGVIDATSKANHLQLDMTNATNAGVMEATGGSLMLIEFSTISNAATGLIAATGSGSRVTLQFSSIVGGTLKTTGGGSLHVSSAATFNGLNPGAPVDIAGNVVVDDNAALTLRGTINNSGSIALESIGNNTVLEIGSGGAALAGGGRVTL